MKNTLKKKLLGGLTVLSIAGSIFFGSLAACTETESNSDNFQKYSIVKMTGNYVLHRNDRMNGVNDIDTKCGLNIERPGRGAIYVHNEDGSTIAIGSELYFGKSLEELEKNHIEYTDVCEECFPDGIEAE